MMPSDWRKVTHQSVCIICSKPDWCAVSADGVWAVCRRVATEGGQHRVDSAGVDFWLYRIGELMPSIPVYSKPRFAGVKRAAPESLHLIYGALLGKLKLSFSHRQNLRDRGLMDHEIERRGYKTLPAEGRDKLAMGLIAQFSSASCAPVPGFYQSGEQWTLAGPPGLVIPVRNSGGCVVALKIRRDGHTHGPKYLYLSSRKQGGPGPGSPIHVPLFDHIPNTIRVTEGELKADIATVLSGILTISIPGAAAWRTALPVLREFNPSQILIAFDADVRRNHHVARALACTVEALHA